MTDLIKMAQDYISSQISPADSQNNQAMVNNDANPYNNTNTTSTNDNRQPNHN